jgi:hypothetical protein
VIVFTAIATPETLPTGEHAGERILLSTGPLPAPVGKINSLPAPDVYASLVDYVHPVQRVIANVFRSLLVEVIQCGTATDNIRMKCINLRFGSHDLGQHILCSVS